MPSQWTPALALDPNKARYSSGMPNNSIFPEHIEKPNPEYSDTQEHVCWIRNTGKLPRSQDFLVAKIDQLSTHSC